MTNKEIRALEAAVRRIAELARADRATVAAIAQSLHEMIEANGDGHKASAFRTGCTGIIDLTGLDRIAALI